MASLPQPRFRLFYIVSFQSFAEIKYNFFTVPCKSPGLWIITLIPSFSVSANGSAFHLQLCRLLHRIKAPQIQWRDRSGLIPASFFDHVSTWAQNRLLSYLNYIIYGDFVKRCNDKYSHPFPILCAVFFHSCYAYLSLLLAQCTHI